MKMKLRRWFDKFCRLGNDGSGADRIENNSPAMVPVWVPAEEWTKIQDKTAEELRQKQARARIGIAYYKKYLESLERERFLLKDKIVDAGCDTDKAVRLIGMGIPVDQIVSILGKNTPLDGIRYKYYVLGDSVPVRVVFNKNGQKMDAEVPDRAMKGMAHKATYLSRLSNSFEVDEVSKEDFEAWCVRFLGRDME